VARRLLVGIGEALWDILGREKFLGGAPANFAYHAAALGDRGVPVSRVGRDRLGREILAALDSLGLCTWHVQVDRTRPTGTVRVRLDRAGKPQFTIAPDVAWDRIRMTDGLGRLASRADAVCYGTLAQRGPVSRRTIRQFLVAAKRAVRICDLNLRAEFLAMGPDDAERLEIVAESIRLADVLKLNDDELRRLGPAFGRRDDAATLERWLLRHFKLRLVCVTHGAKGCVLSTARRRIVAKGVRVKVADTVGSGDAFTAAMAGRLLRRRPLQEIADFANRVGAAVASKAGATPPMDARRLPDRR